MTESRGGSRTVRGHARILDVLIGSGADQPQVVEIGTGAGILAAEYNRLPGDRVEHARMREARERTVLRPGLRI